MVWRLAWKAEGHCSADLGERRYRIEAEPTELNFPFGIHGTGDAPYLREGSALSVCSRGDLRRTLCQRTLPQRGHGESCRGSPKAL